MKRLAEKLMPDSGKPAIVMEAHLVDQVQEQQVGGV
jgi:hypothetical protein